MIVYKQNFKSYAKFNLFIGLVPFLFAYCTDSSNPSEQPGNDTFSNASFHITNFPNVLDITGIPDDPNDLSISSFSDLGAWFSYALPDTAQVSTLGGFTGPFLMTRDNGVWLSESLAKFKLFDVENERKIDFSKAKNIKVSYLPGSLNQEFQVDDLEITLQLIFVSNRSAMVKAEIFNRSNSRVVLTTGWSGNVFLEGAAFKEEDNQLKISFDNSPQFAVLRMSEKGQVKIAEDQDNYEIESVKKLELAAQDSATIYMVQSVFFDKKETEVESEKIKTALDDPEKMFKENKKRWNNYLAEVLHKKNDPYQNIAVKSVETLISNWRGPAGELHHDGLFPSYAYRGFHGFWSWDSWKHAAALVQFAPELAKGQVRAMFDYQDEDGMIADCIFRDTTIENHNWRDTKPPLAAWSVWLIYKKTKDSSFLEEMYPRLLKYHEWWYKYRDHNKNGLAEYGSTDGTRIAAAWESGMDNAVRFDKATMLQNGADSWSLNQESVDLNSYLYAEKKFLASMASVLGKNDKNQQLLKDAETLKQHIQHDFFDEETGYFYDRRLENKSLIKVQGPEGWIPLWAGVATQEQAEQVKNVLVHPEKFATYVPFPTLARDHPEFNPEKGYWRGPVWLDQAYFAIAGLKNYGYETEARKFTIQLFENLDGLKGNKPIYENYHPETGKGLNAKHFSWSAAHLLLLYNELHKDYKPVGVSPTDLYNVSPTDI